MRRVDQFWWVLLACAVVLVGVAAMAQEQWSPDVLNWTVEWTDEIIVVSEDYYLCHGVTLDYAQCDDGDLIGYSSEQGVCCVKQTTARLGLRSDGVVVWRKHD